jgi:predicted HicB family RNase H-like nuclease
MTRINIEIEQELHKKAKLNALLKNMTLIEYIHEALRLKIQEDEKKKK